MITAEQTYAEAIDQIVGETFQTMLATDVLPANEAEVEDKALTALVTFSGTWNGVLTVECGAEPAVHFAKRFLQDDSICEVTTDVCDSLGELANIVAGNLKSVLATGLVLGTPSIVEGREYHIRFCGGRVVSRRHFSTEVGALTVRLVQNPTLT